MSCPICYEETSLQAMERCGHSACMPCLKRWFETCEGTGQSAPSCPTCRKEADLDARVVLGRPFQPLRQNPNDGVVDDLTRQWLSAEAKACRGCGAWIVKSEGCDKMQCLCGYRFCWLCDAPGAECNCSPSNHIFWDNVIRESAFETVEHYVATEEERLDLRSFMEAHAARLAKFRMQERFHLIKVYRRQMQVHYKIANIECLERASINEASRNFKEGIQYAEGSIPDWADEILPYLSSMDAKDVKTLFPGL